MLFTYRTEDLGFVQRAPSVYSAHAVVAAPRGTVFAALADASGWPRWFPGVRSAGYTTAPPHGVGTIRVADVRGTHWEEEMIAWDAPAHLAWTIVRASVPLAQAQVESFALEDGAGGTTVRWTLALHPRLLGRLGAPFTQRTVSRLFHRAMETLSLELGQDRTGRERRSA